MAEGGELLSWWRRGASGSPLRLLRGVPIWVWFAASPVSHPDPRYSKLFDLTAASTFVNALFAAAMPPLALLPHETRTRQSAFEIMTAVAGAGTGQYG